MTLLETVVALGILLVIGSGLVAVAAVGILSTENQGHLSARAAEYAQDKCEQLVSLSYSDVVSDTTQFPACAPPTCTNGTGLAVGGSSDPSNPVAGYVDYLDITGNPMALGAGGAAPNGWYYIRAWQISTPAGCSNLKQLTVTARAAYNVGGNNSGTVTQATVSSLKTSPY